LLSIHASQTAHATGRRLILASSSPYRRELLSRLGLPFEIVSPAIDETPVAGETPAATALRLAEAKAREVAVMHGDAVVIGSDQVATCEGRQIGKPGNHASAVAQLKTMRGKEVEFHSALCVFDALNGRSKVTDVVTVVRFRTLPDAMLEAYVSLEQPFDVAGSAKAEGLGIVLLEKVTSDDPTALIGLPLIALSSMLAEVGITPLDTP
jgi:septum formation protein